MVKINTNQSLQRWDLLPEALREALASEANSAILWKICEDEHLPQEKIRAVARIAGYVLLGFLHPEETTREIKDRLGINPEVAANISRSLDSRIFSRIRDELDKVYAPAGEESAYAPPKILSEIRQPQPQPQTPAGQVFPSPISPPREPAEEFGEKPIILHKEAEFEPGKTAPGFKLEAPPPKFDEAGEKFTPPMRPARLEIGIKPVPAPLPPEPRPQTQAPKTVNYTDLRSPLMSPEQELPAPPKTGPAPPYFRPSPPPQPAKEVNIRAEEIKITIEKPKEEPRKSPLTPPPSPPPPISAVPLPKKRRSFFEWLASLFRKKPKKEIVFAPKVISEEELKREALTIKASMPKFPTPPPRPTQPPQPQPSESPRPSAPTQPTQRPTRGPSVFEEVVDLSTFTKTQKPFPPLDDSNTVDLKNNH